MASPWLRLVVTGERVASAIGLDTVKIRLDESLPSSIPFHRSPRSGTPIHTCGDGVVLINVADGFKRGVYCQFSAARLLHSVNMGSVDKNGLQRSIHRLKSILKAENWILDSPLERTRVFRVDLFQDLALAHPWPPYFEMLKLLEPRGNVVASRREGSRCFEKPKAWQARIYDKRSELCSKGHSVDLQIVPENLIRVETSFFNGRSVQGNLKIRTVADLVERLPDLDSIRQRLLVESIFYPDQLEPQIDPAKLMRKLRERWANRSGKHYQKEQFECRAALLSNLSLDEIREDLLDRGYSVPHARLQARWNREFREELGLPTAILQADDAAQDLYREFKAGIRDGEHFGYPGLASQDIKG